MFPNHDQLTWRPGVSRAGVLCGDRKCLDPQNKVTNYLHRGNYFEGSYQLTDLSQPDMILFFQLDQLLARPRTESKDYAHFCKRGLQWQVAATLGWALNPTRSPKKCSNMFLVWLQLVWGTQLAQESQGRVTWRHFLWLPWDVVTSCCLPLGLMMMRTKKHGVFAQ